MKRVNVALIGYKFMGRAHSNAWRQAAAFFDPPLAPVLKVICGRDEAEVGRAAARFGWQEHATRWKEVVGRPDIDIVDICTPGDTHPAIALAAAEAGKAILCEKPLANNLADAERMLAAARARGCPHMLCHNYRRAPAVALAHKLIAEGRIGEIHHFRGTYLQDWLLDPEFPRVWRLERSKAGSGALGDLLSHTVDLARHLVGEIAEVAGLLKTFVAERPAPGGGAERLPVEVDDAALALVRFEGGAVGSIEATRFAAGRKNHNRFEINGSRGSLAFDLERMNELELYEGEGPDGGFRTILATDPAHPYMGGWWPPGHIIGYEHTFTHTVLDLLRALAAGEQPKPDFEDGVRTQRVLDAVERASRSRGWERV
jgi:predicted dehydrogenase